MCFCSVSIGQDTSYAIRGKDVIRYIYNSAAPLNVSRAIDVQPNYTATIQSFKIESTGWVKVGDESTGTYTPGGSDDDNPKERIKSAKIAEAKKHN